MAGKPLLEAYPQKLCTIGDYLLQRRLELGLLQKEVAPRIGVTVDTITGWELSRTKPGVQYLPAIIAFLGIRAVSDRGHSA